MASIAAELSELVKKWFVPPGYWALFRESYLRLKARPSLQSLKKNKQFRNLHSGEGCYILCNGPSLNKQNIGLLAGQTLFSVSNGYLHPDIELINPLYHCVPRLHYDSKITPATANEWFSQMDKRLPRRTKVFLSITERGVVEGAQLFASREVFYLALGSGNWPLSSNFDIAGQMPEVQSVPIMCLLIAIKMGFTTICLLGADHDSLFTQEYQYFYGDTWTPMQGKDLTVHESGRIAEPASVQIATHAVLWSQYQMIQEYCKEHGIQIYNATAGGALDVFPRRSLEETLAM